MSEKSIRNFFSFTGATLISKILGFVRDAMVVASFGGGRLTDAYYAAFRITNLFKRTLGEGSVNSAVLPVLEKEKNSGMEEASRFLSAVLILGACVSLAASLLGIIFSREIVTAVTYGFTKDPRQYELTSLLTAVMMIQVFFITLSAVYQSALNAARRFFLPAASSSVFSILIISYLLALKWGFFPEVSENFKITALAWISSVSGLVQCLALRFFVSKTGFQTRWTNPLKNKKIKAALILSLPALFGAAQDQISMFINTIFASFMEGGSITALYNSARIVHFPIALFAVSAAQTALPELAKNFKKDEFRFRGAFNFSVKVTSFMLFPAAFGLMALSLPVSRALFEHGKFTFEQSLLTSSTLLCLAIGLPGYGLNKVASSLCYAAGETALIVRAILLQFFLNIVLCVFLFPMGAPGLALATSASSLAAAAVYAKSLNGIFPGIISRRTAIFVLKSFSAAVLTGLLAFFMNSLFSGVLSVVLTIPSSILFYLAAMKLMKTEIPPNLFRGTNGN